MSRRKKLQEKGNQRDRDSISAVAATIVQLAARIKFNIFDICYLHPDITQCLVRRTGLLVAIFYCFVPSACVMVNCLYHLRSIVKGVTFLENKGHLMAHKLAKDHAWFRSGAFPIRMRDIKVVASNKSQSKTAFFSSFFF